MADEVGQVLADAPLVDQRVVGDLAGVGRVVIGRRAMG
jgi:hypothetical protein